MGTGRPAASQTALEQHLEFVRRGVALIERTRDRDCRQAMLGSLVRDLQRLLRLIEGASQELRLAALSLEKQVHQIRFGRRPAGWLEERRQQLGIEADEKIFRKAASE